MFVYGENNGVIWDVAVNESRPSLDVYTVGIFDTVTQSSQVQLCSVASFDGSSFEKVRFLPLFSYFFMLLPFTFIII